jgi:putative endonuclease
MTNDIHAALNREKQLKRWKRDWKIRLIEEMNSDWEDLFFEIGGSLPSQG